MTAVEVLISDWSSDVCSSDLGQRGIVGDGALGEEGAVAEAVGVVDAEVVAAHAKSVQGIGVADIAMCAANGDVEKAIAFAEAWFDQVEIGRASCCERECQVV